MNDGWRCPGCGRCYAPFVAQCGLCPNPGTFTTSGFEFTAGEWYCQVCNKRNPVRSCGDYTACPYPISIEVQTA